MVTRNHDTAEGALNTYNISSATEKFTRLKKGRMTR